MDDDPLPERMARYEALADEVQSVASERDAVGDEVAARLTETVEEAVAAAGVSIEPTGGTDGHRFRFEARLDRAALVARLTDDLPPGFVVSHVNDDGSLSVEWTGDDRTPSKRERGAILKAIVAEATVTDDDGLIESVPSRSAVLDRAVELGIDREEAADRLGRLAVLDVVDIADGRVYPDTNFSRY